MSENLQDGTETRTTPRPRWTRLIGPESGHDIRVFTYDLEAEAGEWIKPAADGDQPAEDYFVLKTYTVDEPEPWRVHEVRRKPRE